MNPYTETEQLHRLKAYIYFQQCKSQCIIDKPNPGQLTFTLTTQWHAYVELLKVILIYGIDHSHHFLNPWIVRSKFLSL